MTLYDYIELIRGNYGDNTELLKRISQLTDDEKTALLLRSLYTIEAIGDKGD